MNIDEALREAMAVEGAVGVSLVDYDSGMTLGQQGGNALLDLEAAGAGNTEVIRAKLRTIASLQLDDTIEDILITLQRQYHIIRPLPEAKGSRLFLYLVLDRTRANLALARHHLRRVDQALIV
ncbi:MULTISPECIES: hypothetical protein [Actinosynnema]|uniref:Roadblock/LC7 family protein n=3 Tax=Actinosynnema TaxID=40566 RepID=C6WD68_ACTMD|nr:MULTISPECIES: hypothetical protein [Actinosynnema]AXX31119.1 hypothetical protein APASM_3754 [Actinosynnema pretiosum subsp. pretiosum]ACU37687.1 conserved hypothetical protein [Actinosynnema mirum DSM 43827]ATE55125.1 hypothetical protein CNX65_19050 [Actinosynnema pretiosum]MCP2098178.1 hypothetical protein [Actinosynnema pretiosum]QUF04803.1 hypothetical protein KCV87_01290 [Actinosynnema pretiosum subsp. pretiosum]